MNTKQRRLILFGIVVMVLMGLFPPWTKSVHVRQVHFQRPAGYALIFEPPEPQGSESLEIDFVRLLIQWIGIALLVGGGILYLKDSGGSDSCGPSPVGEVRAGSPSDAPQGEHSASRADIVAEPARHRGAAIREYLAELTADRMGLSTPPPLENGSAVGSPDRRSLFGLPPVPGFLALCLALKAAHSMYPPPDFEAGILYLIAALIVVWVATPREASTSGDEPARFGARVVTFIRWLRSAGRP
ncbi:MAG: hypothetical protein ACHQ4J_05025 [Candidatus Binatia bacterium]